MALGSHGERDTRERATRPGFIKANDRDKLDALIAGTGRVTHELLRSLDPTT